MYLTPKQVPEKFGYHPKSPFYYVLPLTLMNKLKTIQFALLIAKLGIFSMSAPIQAAIKQNPQQSITEVNSTYLALSWAEIWESLRRKKATAGSRKPGMPPICMIAPNKLHELDRDNSAQDGDIEVWSDRPLFIWQESMVGIEVRHRRSHELMWSQPLEPEARSITYGGKPLRSGQVYYWRETLPLQEVPRVYFRIMTVEESAVITAELEQLESKLKAIGEYGDKIALERVNYLIEPGLWSDALREVYSKPNLFPELIDKIETHDFCEGADSLPN